MYHEPGGSTASRTGRRGWVFLVKSSTNANVQTIYIQCVRFISNHLKIQKNANDTKKRFRERLSNTKTEMSHSLRSWCCGDPETFCKSDITIFHCILSQLTFWRFQNVIYKLVSLAPFADKLLNSTEHYEIRITQKRPFGADHFLETENYNLVSRQCRISSSVMKNIFMCLRGVHRITLMPVTRWILMFISR